MPSFILRQLDPVFWARVQAKARAEGQTVKAVILRLLTAWLGVCVLAILFSACSDMQVSPVAPSASPVVVQQITPPPVTTGTTFSIDINANGGQTFTDTPFQTSVIVSGSADPTLITVNCNNGAELQAYPGRRGILGITCVFPTEGSYPIVATAVNQTTGFSTSARITVTASARPLPPPPPPPPTPVPPQPRTLILSETCSVKTATMSCNVSGQLSDGQTVTSGLSNVKWDLGDGTERRTSGPTIQYTYAQSGTYHVIVSADYQSLHGTDGQTVTVP